MPFAMTIAMTIAIVIALFAVTLAGFVWLASGGHF